MQVLEIDWNQFLDQLPSFQRLPVEARRLFLEKVRPNQPVSVDELGEHRQTLVSAGFLLCGPKHKNAIVPQHYRPLCRVMRSLYRHRVFDSPSPTTFYQYLSEHFTGHERSDFGRKADYYGDSSLYSQASAIEWLRRFLEAEQWGQSYGYNERQRNFFSDGVMETTKKLERKLMSCPSPHCWPKRTGCVPRSAPTC